MPFLEKEYLNEIKVFSNRLDFSSYPIKPIFPHAREGQALFSAVCKKSVILNNSDSEDIIVFIGDGITDFQAVNAADIIFAKDELAAYCNKEKLPHYPYKSFFDVKQIFSKLFENNSLKKRRQAELFAQDSFEEE